MNILIVGSGGREHAFIAAFAKSRFGPMLYSAPGNGDISEYAVCFDIGETDAAGIVKAAVDNSVDVVLVSSCDALAAGAVDELEAHGVRAFGPRKNAAVAAASGTYIKQLFRKYGIPSVDYDSFDNFAEAEAFVGSTCNFPVSIRADGLSKRYSVIASSRAEAVEALRAMASETHDLSTGSRVTVAGYDEGGEFTVPVITDGKTAVPMPAVQVYRRLPESGGKFTAGVGAICPVPSYTPAVAETCRRTIFQPTVSAFDAEGRPFRGILQFTLAFRKGDVAAVECSPCIGDPEAETLLPLLESDLTDAVNAAIDGSLSEKDVRFSHRTCVSVVAAAGGYPDCAPEGGEIKIGDGFPQDASLRLFHVGTEYRGGKLVVSGGRVLSVTATADSADSAIYKAYQNVSRISFDGMQYRHDIGKNSI